ncbi:peptide chain release factor 3 [Buchnera aphidicola (Kurisakia onigurumii)]|uniref:peptide chain release factor 3 n=1 Tax=Buchnera aphidicola TaxID=9 RepID=UPI0031B6A766
MNNFKKNKNLLEEIHKRRTFAIISHPDSGKTTITEKILFIGKVIHNTGSIKPKKNKKYTKSDWMHIEKKRGISITTSVMRFIYKNKLINLLDTPGHSDFSEDTYRILTAVDCCLMIIDASKGVEEQTRKLLSVARMYKKPIITFINKIDRDFKNPIKLLEEIESEFNIISSPITWPIGTGSFLQGIYNLKSEEINFYSSFFNNRSDLKKITGLFHPHLKNFFDYNTILNIRREVHFLKKNFFIFNKKEFLQGNLTPVFFGTALKNFGIDQVLQALVEWAPNPLYRRTNIRKIYPQESKFSGFIFKIQANMDLKHRDRIAFMRIVSGKYFKGIKIKQTRTLKNLIIRDAFYFLAGERYFIQEAYPGDIIGIHNHGNIQIGDTFTEGEKIKFLGIPYFSPEIFRKIRLKNPLQQKKLLKGLFQLSEEGSVQIFRSIQNNSLIIGVIGILQFEIISDRLRMEYNIEPIYENINICCIRWISSKYVDKLNFFKQQNESYLGLDKDNLLIYFFPSMINLKIITARNKDIIFSKTREYQIM